MLCDDLEGGEGNEAEDGGDICIIIIHLQCLTAEVNKTL